MFTDMTGKELDRTPKGVKLRLAAVYRRPEDTMTGIMAEIKELSDKDLEDYRIWFGAEGYPCN